jgi:hypothetical protein
MSLGRIATWGIVGILALVPINWIRLWISGEIPKDATISQFLIGTLICWVLAGGVAYFLIVSARGIKRRKEKEALALQQMLEQPLTEVRPNKAIIKPGEKAYAAVLAELMEVQTVGYSGNTAGLSVRIAKGVTVRTGGIRGKAVKDMVSAASGELVITDTRVLFAGDRKSFAIPLSQLLSATNYSDGFGFSDSKKTYTLMTSNDADRLKFAVALQKVLHA